MATQTQTPAPTAARPTAPAANATPAAPATDAKLALDDIGAVAMLSADLAEQAAPQRSRNERQVKMDEIVGKLHKTWKAAGQPTTWPKMVEKNVVATYFVDPPKASDLKLLVNRAVSYHGVRVRWGTPFVATEKLVQTHKLPTEYIGREVISFAIMDKRPRTTSDNSTSTPATS